MTLYEAQKGCCYCVEGLCVEPAITRRLQALGLNDGTVVNVLNRKKQGALIVQVRGTRLALGKHISSSIQVSEGGRAASRPEGGEGLADEMGIHGICIVGDKIFPEGTAAEEKSSVGATSAGGNVSDGGRGESAKKEDESREL